MSVFSFRRTKVFIKQNVGQTKTLMIFLLLPVISSETGISCRFYFNFSFERAVSDFTCGRY